MIRFGLPSAAHLVLDVGAFAFFVLLTADWAPPRCRQQHRLSINNVAFMPLLGLSIAAQSLLANTRATRFHLQPPARLDCAQTGCWYMLLVAASFILFPAHYFALFTGRGAAAMPMDAVVSVGRCCC
jgi:Na+-driven multidrug efflux pump